MAESIECPFRALDGRRIVGNDSPDRWESRGRSVDTEHDLFCSFCGSLHPERFIELVKLGHKVIPTDKSYKAIVDYKGQWYKFYFIHFSVTQASRMLSIYKRGQIAFGYPGFFYNAPLFIKIVESANPLSFGAIVETVEVIEDGSVIQLLDPVYDLIIQEISRDPDFMYKIDPRKWEELIAAAYEREGYDKVILTPRSGDLGRDVIAIREGFGSVKFIEQVKAYKPGHVVTADEVRALIGVLSSERDATKAVFTTTSEFAPRLSQDKLIKPYIPYRLELVDKDRLIARLTGK